MYVAPYRLLPARPAREQPSRSQSTTPQRGKFGFFLVENFPVLQTRLAVRVGRPQNLEMGCGDSGRLLWASRRPTANWLFEPARFTRSPLRRRKALSFKFDDVVVFRPKTDSAINLSRWCPGFVSDSVKDSIRSSQGSGTAGFKFIFHAGS